MMLIKDIQSGEFKYRLIDLAQRGFEVGRIFYAAPIEWSEHLYLALLWEQVLAPLENKWLEGKVDRDFLINLFKGIPEASSDFTYLQVITQKRIFVQNMEIRDCVTALQDYLSDFGTMRQIDEWLEQRGLNKVKSPSYLKKILDL